MSDDAGRQFDVYLRRLRKQRNAISAAPIAHWHRESDGADMVLYRDGSLFERKCLVNWHRVGGDRLYLIEQAHKEALAEAFQRVNLAIEP